MRSRSLARWATRPGAAASSAASTRVSTWVVRASVRVTGNPIAACADEEVEVRAGVGSEHGSHVQLLPAAGRPGQPLGHRRGRWPGVELLLRYVDVDAPGGDVQRDPVAGAHPVERS